MALVAAAGFWLARSGGSSETTAFVPLTAEEGLERHPAISPDGREVAFVANRGGEAFHLYVKAIDGGGARRLTASGGNECCPAWSPDGTMLAFVRLEGTNGSLWTIRASGGAERRLGGVHPWFGTGLGWSPRGNEIALSDREGEQGEGEREPFAIFALSLETGEKRRLTRPSRRVLGDALPRFSPDGRRIAFSRVSAEGDALTVADVYVIPSAGGEPRPITTDREFVGDLAWTADGRSVVVASGRDGPNHLWRVRLGGGGPPVRVFPDPDPSLVRTMSEVATEVGAACRFSLSGDRLAWTALSYDTDIYGLDLRALAPLLEPLIVSPLPDESPQFSPDGTRIAFSSSRSGQPEIWTCDREGRDCGPLSRLDLHSGTPRWSPDGRSIAFDSRPDGQSDIMVKDAATHETRRITSERAEDVVPSFSRDGRFIYFASNRSGRFEVWKAPASGGAATQITREGGFAAFESADGKELVYTKPDRPGLFGRAASGGPETRLSDQPRCWGYWTVSRDGVLLLDTNGPPTLERLNLTTGRLTRLAVVDRPPACGESGLALSPDQRFVLYVGAEHRTRLELGRVGP